VQLSTIKWRIHRGKKLLRDEMELLRKTARHERGEVKKNAETKNEVKNGKG
jgi:hypothetical protein